MSYLLNQARRMADAITSKLNHWEDSVTMVFKGNTYEIKGLYVRHNKAYDEVGVPVNQTVATLTISVDELTRKGVPFKNAGGVIQLGQKGQNAKITVSDTLKTREYQIASTRPDATLGLIVCELEQFSSASNNPIVI